MVVEKSIQRVVDPILDPELLPWSYAYRRGLGVNDALRALTEARDDGATHVLRLDIAHCFDSIPRRRVLDQLRTVLPDEDLVQVIRLLVYRVERGMRRSAALGLHQGSPLSPVLCNLYLDSFDRAMLGAGIKVVRYSDDIAVPLDRPADADRASKVARAALGQLGLKLSDRKEQLASFAAGVPFLGVTLTEQSTTAEERLSRPLRTTIFVTHQGALLRTKGERLIVEAKGEQLLGVGWRRVRQVVCFGRVGLTTPFLHHAVGAGVDIVLLSQNGRCDGRVQSPFRTGAAMRHQQHLLAEDTTASLSIARQIVRGKIANMRTGLLRSARRLQTSDVAALTASLHRFRVSAATATTTEVLMGIEGAASRAYFDGLRRALDSQWAFDARRRRPPPDPVNAMLSFGYTLLTYEATAACESAGLDPSVGFLHGPRGNRPALALDLVEEFRPVIIDSMVLRCISLKMLTVEDFDTSVGEDGQQRCLLTEVGRRTFVAAYERRLLTLFSYSQAAASVPYRQALHGQAAHLAEVIQGRRATYQPVAWK